MPSVQNVEIVYHDRLTDILADKQFLYFSMVTYLYQQQTFAATSYSLLIIEARQLLYCTADQVHNIKLSGFFLCMGLP